MSHVWGYGCRGWYSRMSRFCPNNVSYGGSYFSIGRRLSFVVDDSVNLSLPLCFPSLYPFCPSVCLRSRFPPLLLGEFRSGFSWLLLPPCLSLPSVLAVGVEFVSWLPLSPRRPSKWNSFHFSAPTQPRAPHMYWHIIYCICACQLGSASKISRLKMCRKCKNASQESTFPRLIILFLSKWRLGVLQSHWQCWPFWSMSGMGGSWFPQ